MIFVRDKGRMCNNILQYGHLYAWGREHGRQTVSMRFAYKYRYFHICHTRHHNFLTYLFAKYAAKCYLLPVANFDVDTPAHIAQQEQVLLRHRHVVAQGWYAHWHDLFLKYKNEIVALFHFDQKVRQTPDRLLARLPQCDLRIGIHIRRGDYRTWHNGRYFYDDQQYIGVIKSFLAEQNKGQTAQLFVCGNDPDLDEAAFQKAFPDVAVCFPKGNPGEDLYLLSQCDRLIGAPSTFTLVASMYRDVPLYWIEDPNLPLTDSHFGHFDQLMQQIK